MTGGGTFIPERCEIQSNGNLKCDENDKEIVIEIEGEKPTSGKIKFGSGKIKQVRLAYGEKYIIDSENGTLIYGPPPKTYYENGDVVYYDVLKKSSCTEYHEDNSKTGYNGIYEGEFSRKTTDNQNSCLKFYAFNDKDGNKTLNLILDHNATARVLWNSSGLNGSGPSTSDAELLGILKSDTAEWKGTIEPTSYEYKGNEKNYTLDYSGYKARIIRAQEIAQIVGKTPYDEFTSEIYYITLSTESCTDNDDTTKCVYGWLYDRTSTSCITAGCFSNSDVEEKGYWTVSAHPSSLYHAWYVGNEGSMNFAGNVSHTDNYGGGGVRPVIEVLKSNLS